MKTRQELVAAARSYLGTPFHHQGRMPGAGLDCAGTVICAARQCGFEVEDFGGYPPVPGGGVFMNVVRKHCDVIPQEEVLPGDFMVFSFKTEPHHIALVVGVDPVTILHAYMQVRRVVENYLDATWQKRLKGCFRIRGIK